MYHNKVHFVRSASYPTLGDRYEIYFRGVKGGRKLATQIEPSRTGIVRHVGAETADGFTAVVLTFDGPPSGRWVNGSWKSDPDVKI